MNEGGNWLRAGQWKNQCQMVCSVIGMDGGENYGVMRDERYSTLQRVARVKIMESTNFMPSEVKVYKFNMFIACIFLYSCRLLVI